MFSETDPPVEKRHSGRSGPTSPEGKAVSSQNAVKHGGTARTLILGGLPPHEWDADQVKGHDLSLRYKNAAERTFQRNYRALEQHIKTHRPKAAPALAAAVPPKPTLVSPVAESKVTAPFRQDITVTLADGKPQIDYSPSNESLLNLATETARPGDSILRFFHFPEAVPTEFDWLFPDVLTRVPGVKGRQYMSYETWLRLNTAERLHPSGLPLDHAPFAKTPNSDSPS